MKKEKWQVHPERNPDPLGLTKYVDKILADLEKSKRISKRRNSTAKQSPQKKGESIQLKEFPFVF